jgi:hypothetical protein
VTTYVLVHSPLVGPSTWEPVAAELRANGTEVVIPTISGEALSAGWRAVVSDVSRQVARSQGATFVAHSGAGMLLAHIVAASHAISPQLIFVDATISSTETDTPLASSDMFARLNELSVDGRLPPWSDWFGSEAMTKLLGDDELILRLLADMPRLSLAYFMGEVPALDVWPATHNAYLQLSAAYSAEAEEATRRGWPLEYIDGQHLDIVTRAPEVVGVLRHFVRSFANG